MCLRVLKNGNRMLVLIENQSTREENFVNLELLWFFIFNKIQVYLFLILALIHHISTSVLTAVVVFLWCVFSASYLVLLLISPIGFHFYSHFQLVLPS